MWGVAHCMAATNTCGCFSVHRMEMCRTLETYTKRKLHICESRRPILHGSEGAAGPPPGICSWPLLYDTTTSICCVPQSATYKIKIENVLPPFAVQPGPAVVGLCGGEVGVQGVLAGGSHGRVGDAEGKKVMGRIGKYGHKTETY